MSRTFGLYILGFIAAAVAVAFPSFSWLSPVTFLLVIPLGAIWIWKSQGRSLWDLGYRFSSSWFRFLAIGLLLGLGIPIIFQVIQVMGGWITLTPREGSIHGLVSYLPALLLRMVFIVAIEEFVFRGFLLNALEPRTSFQIAAILSSVLWGVSHLTSMVNEGLELGLILIGMASFTAWGITLCLCYLATIKSLWLPYGIHLGVNLGFSLVGWFFITHPSAPKWWIGHPAWSPESGLIGVIVWLILAIVAYRLTANAKFSELAAN